MDARLYPTVKPNAIQCAREAQSGVLAAPRPWKLMCLYKGGSWQYQCVRVCGHIKLRAPCSAGRVSGLPTERGLFQCSHFDYSGLLLLALPEALFTLPSSNAGLQQYSGPWWPGFPHLLCLAANIPQQARICHLTPMSSCQVSKGRVWLSPANNTWGLHFDWTNWGHVTRQHVQSLRLRAFMHWLATVYIPCLPISDSFRVLKLIKLRNFRHS